MENYESPIIIESDTLAEGVFAASGSSEGTCYTASYNIHQRPETGRGDYRIQINGYHNADHTKETQWLHITFNQPVHYESSQGVLEEGDNTNYLRIRYAYHQNPTDNIGLGDLVVSTDSDIELEVTNIKMTD